MNSDRFNSWYAPQNYEQYEFFPFGEYFSPLDEPVQVDGYQPELTRHFFLSDVESND